MSVRLQRMLAYIDFLRHQYNYNPVIEQTKNLNSIANQ